MNVQTGRLVAIEYRVTLPDGEIVEDGTPVEYLHGAEMLLPALEAQLTGMRESERKSFTLSAKDAYGERDESSVITLPRRIFPDHVDLTPGARLAARTVSNEIHPLTVLKLEGDQVVVDLNHPLAGKPLSFDVRVHSVRESSPQSLFTNSPRSVELV